MDLNKLLGLILLCWLIGAIVLMLRSLRKGRGLAKTLATNHPKTYRSLGRPRPGYFQSVRSRRFARFIARREYENIDDTALSARFEKHRKDEARLVMGLLVSLLIVFSLVLVVCSTT
jgi:hypothetical protein